MSTDMERAFYASDPAWDSRFVTAVRTTGIFCRPSCRVRKPLLKNVEYLPDASAARAAGYRACLRCQPENGTAVTMRAIPTPIGPMLAGATADAIVLCDFADRRMIDAQVASVRRRIGPTREGNAPLLDQLESQLGEYFAGTRRDFDLPIDMPGSAFQERVWDELRRIPYGATISYRDWRARRRRRRIPRRRAPRTGLPRGGRRPVHRVIATEAAGGTAADCPPAAVARPRGSIRVVGEVDRKHLVGPFVPRTPGGLFDCQRSGAASSCQLPSSTSSSSSAGARR